MHAIPSPSLVTGTSDGVPQAPLDQVSAIWALSQSKVETANLVARMILRLTVRELWKRKVMWEGSGSTPPKTNQNGERE